MRDIFSHGMVMCAKADDVIEPLQPPTGAVPGDVVSFDKFPGAVAVVLCGGFFRGMGGGLKTSEN